MSDGVHLLIPFATCSAAACGEALATLQLPRLRKLLARLSVESEDLAGGQSLSMPHERVLARAVGLEGVDGLLPLAAWQVHQSGREAAGAGWAWVTPCHWQVGRGHVEMAPPAHLQLDGEASRLLLAAMQPYFAEDGIALAYEAPGLWLARGDIFRTAPSASIDRVAGRDIDPWLPAGDAGRPLRKLQQEMQMLLYTHAVNDERQRKGLAPVNSFWVSGTGALPPGPVAAPPMQVQVTQDLRDAALQQDWPAWRAAWQRIDTQQCGELDEVLAGGRAVRVSLCGERGARTWSSRGQGAWRRMKALFGAPSASAMMEGL